MATFLANEINSTGGVKMDRKAHVQIRFPLKDKKMEGIQRHFFPEHR